MDVCTSYPPRRKRLEHNNLDAITSSSQSLESWRESTSVSPFPHVCIVSGSPLVAFPDRGSGPRRSGVSKMHVVYSFVEPSGHPFVLVGARLDAKLENDSSWHLGSINVGDYVVDGV